MNPSREKQGVHLAKILESGLALKYQIVNKQLSVSERLVPFAPRWMVSAWASLLGGGEGGSSACFLSVSILG